MRQHDRRQGDSGINVFSVVPNQSVSGEGETPGDSRRGRRRYIRFPQPV